MQIARNYLSPTIRRVSLLARIMPLPVALSPPHASVFLPRDARYRTCVPRTGTILLFRFFGEAYRHLRFSRLVEHRVSGMDNVDGVLLLFSFPSILLIFRMIKYRRLHEILHSQLNNQPLVRNQL